MKEYHKLAEGVEALIKLHHADVDYIAKYLQQYITLR